MPTPPRRHSPPRSTRWAFAALVAAALVVANLLGVVHRVAHAVRASNATAGVVDAAWPQALFDAHRDAGSCDLYDQLSHGPAAPCAPAPSIALPLPERYAEAGRYAAAALQRDAVRARGPPSPG